jgi:phosphorylcholine metabolism protein LicD
MQYKLLRSSKDEWGIKELQDKILEIMLFIHKLCVNNDIEYFLMGGSALGALRHDGFIPWDDDLDIFMTVKNYRKFRDVFSKLENRKYYLQEWAKCGDMISMAKVRDSSTTLIEHSIRDWDINHGVYVDIFLLHTAAPTLRKKSPMFLGKIFNCKRPFSKRLPSKKLRSITDIVFSSFYPQPLPCSSRLEATIQIRRF